MSHLPIIPSSLFRFSRETFLQLARAAAFLVIAAFLATAAPAQQQGPLPPPASGGSSGSPGMTSSSTSAPASPSRSETHDESEISKTPPAIPVEQIIAKFSQ